MTKPTGLLSVFTQHAYQLYPDSFRRPLHSVDQINRYLHSPPPAVCHVKSFRADARWIPSL